MDKDKSGLHIVTLAYVSKVSEGAGEDSNFIEAFPIEIVNEHIGSINAEEELGEDVIINGSKEKVIVSKSVTIKSEWLPISQSNRITSPNVVVGEIVALYRFDKVDKYYWDTILNDLALRRLETVVHMYSNTTVYGEVLDFDNSYWSSVCTKTKNMKIHMSDNDGELTTYDVELDGLNGTAELKDGRGNYFKLNSKEDDFTVTTNKSIHLKTKDVIVDCDNYTLNASKTITEKTKTFSITADDMTIAAKAYSISGDSYTHKYGNSTLTTNVMLNGNLKVTGNTSLSGNAKVVVQHKGPKSGIVL